VQTSAPFNHRGAESWNSLPDTRRRHEPENKGKLIGQKSPLKLEDIWAVSIRLQIASRIRDLALFALAIDGFWSAEVTRYRLRKS